MYKYKKTGQIWIWWNKEKVNEHGQATEWYSTNKEGDGIYFHKDAASEPKELVPPYNFGTAGISSNSVKTQIRARMKLL